MLRIVADLGNSRLKWGRSTRTAGSTPSIALPLDDPRPGMRPGTTGIRRGAEPSRWAIASVNPPVAERLAAFLDGRGRRAMHLVSHRRPRSRSPWTSKAPRPAGPTGPWRSSAALRQMPAGPARPGRLVRHGDHGRADHRRRASGKGASIAPGLFLSARALHLLTAQLPLVHPDSVRPLLGPLHPRLARGRDLLGHRRRRPRVDRPADRSTDGQHPWVVWTGGDAPAARPAVSGERR